MIAIASSPIAAIEARSVSQWHAHSEADSENNMAPCQRERKREKILAASNSHFKYSLPLGLRLSHAKPKRHFRLWATLEFPILPQDYRSLTFTEAALPTPTYTRLTYRETLTTYPYRAPVKHED